ncbi:hypothetical protein MNBD_ALPHA06-2148 [hydrothermal vent metagenome]|uniref:Uncharacterized protein n=1 Tax=hydrothermal vent metagenome TaxID=652676 RepID=A0A3B0SLM0_9ZZZZ
MKQKLTLFGVIVLGLALVGTPVLASASAGKKTAAKKSSSDSSRPNYVEFPQMTSSILQGYRVRGMMTLGFGLEIADNAKRNRAQERLPRLQDMYTSEWNRYAGSIYQSGDVPDAKYISRRMQSATDRMLGEGTAIFLISNLIVNAN